MWCPVEQEGEDIGCSEAEQFALPSSDTRHQSFQKTTRTYENKNSLKEQTRHYPTKKKKNPPKHFPNKFISFHKMKMH